MYYQKGFETIFNVFNSSVANFCNSRALPFPSARVLLLPTPEAQDHLRSRFTLQFKWPGEPPRVSALKPSLLLVAATAGVLNQWLPSPVLKVPPSSPTETNRKGHVATEANGKSGRESLAAAVSQWSLGLRLRYPGAEVAAQLPPWSCSPRPYPRPVFKLPASRRPRRPPRSLHRFRRSQALTV